MLKPSSRPATKTELPRVGVPWRTEKQERARDLRYNRDYLDAVRTRPAASRAGLAAAFPRKAVADCQDVGCHCPARQPRRRRSEALRRVEPCQDQQTGYKAREDRLRPAQARSRSGQTSVGDLLRHSVAQRVSRRQPVSGHPQRTAARADAQQPRRQPQRHARGSRHRRPASDACRPAPDQSEQRAPSIGAAARPGTAHGRQGAGRRDRSSRVDPWPGLGVGRTMASRTHAGRSPDAAALWPPRL